MSGRQHVLLVTRDGFGKRVPVDQIRRTHRSAKGVRVSAAPPVAALIVDEHTDEVIVQSRQGMTQRLRVRDVPIRRQRNPNSKGARIMRLDRGDEIATVAVVPQIDSGGHETPSPGKEDRGPSDPLLQFLGALWERYTSNLGISAAVVFNRPELARLAPAKTESQLDAWFELHPTVGTFVIEAAGVDSQRRRLWRIGTAMPEPAEEEAVLAIYAEFRAMEGHHTPEANQRRSQLWRELERLRDRRDHVR
jgi:hypothetical protein